MSMTAKSSNRPAMRLVGCFVLTALALIATGCFHGPTSGDEAKLKALRNDPMARYEPQGARLVDSDEVEEHTAFGKHVAAEIARVFSLPERRLEGELQRALDGAATAGWTVSDGPVVRLSKAFGQTARRRLASDWAHLTVTAYPNGRPNGGHGPVLVIRLDHS